MCVSEGKTTKPAPPINCIATLIICGHTWSQRQRRRGLRYATNREDKVQLSDVGKCGRCFQSAQREAVGHAENDWRNFRENRGCAVQPESFHSHAGMSQTHQCTVFIGSRAENRAKTHTQSKEKHVFNQASSICQHCVCVCVYRWPNTPLHRSCHWENR